MPDSTQTDTTPGLTASAETSPQSTGLEHMTTTSVTDTASSGKLVPGTTPPGTLPTSRTRENSSIVTTLNSSGAQCYCRCGYQAPSNTSSSPTAHLHVVEKSSTSSFRRRRSSQWTSPSVTTIAISATMISSATAFLVFFACCDLATLARYCSARKTAAVKPENA
ncbi:uncharacterized protein [Littorina saxatilis]|uniref:uncharacterized protein n=1 Tax=Littorina saxatilis TaxID=31220 RepID=UPI0038B58384